jgi:hypothetical protein
MRPRHREISTLNLAMLDIIAGAMAAFLILMVILLPYYERETVNQEALIAELRQDLAAARRPSGTRPARRRRPSRRPGPP